MYPMVLDIVDGHHELVACPCRLLEAIRPPPVVRLSVPVDYQDPPALFGSLSVVLANQKAIEFCRGWVETYVMGKYYPSPILCGPVGRGKTRLLWTIFKEIADRISAQNLRLYETSKAQANAQNEDLDRTPPYRSPRLAYLSAPKFSEDVRMRSGFHGDIVAYRAELVAVDLLAIDDIGAENPTDLVREQFYLLVEERVNRRMPIIAACNFSRNELEQWVGSRIHSRLLGACEMVEIHATDMRAKEKERRIRK